MYLYLYTVNCFCLNIKWSIPNKIMSYGVDLIFFLYGRKIWLSYYDMGLSLSSSVCRHNGFCTIIFILVNWSHRNFNTMLGIKLRFGFIWKISDIFLLLPVSLNCPFLIAPLDFSNVDFQTRGPKVPFFLQPTFDDLFSLCSY